MPITHKFLSTITGILLFGVSASAQVAINAGSTYTQDFNTPAFATEVAAAGTGVAAWGFTNNSTYPGWVRQVSAGGQPDRSDLDFIGELNGMTTRFGNFGNGGSFTEPTTDRALMSLIRAAGSEISFGVVFQVSGTSIGSLAVSYTGEQWFRAVLANTLQFEYKVLNSFDSDAFKINDEESGWTSVADLDFVALQTGGALKINGNDDLNRSNLSATINLASAANDGEYIVFRWRQVDPDPTTGAAQSGLGVDDLSVSFTAIPEPSTVAVWTGLAVLGLIMYRRKRV